MEKEETWALWKVILGAGAIVLVVLLIGIFVVVLSTSYFDGKQPFAFEVHLSRALISTEYKMYCRSIVENCCRAAHRNLVLFQYET